jgi:hypothetical protein
MPSIIFNSESIDSDHRTQRLHPDDSYTSRCRRSKRSSTHLYTVINIFTLNLNVFHPHRLQSRLMRPVTFNSQSVDSESPHSQLHFNFNYAQNIAYKHLYNAVMKYFPTFFTSASTQFFTQRINIQQHMLRSHHRTIYTISPAYIYCSQQRQYLSIIFSIHHFSNGRLQCASRHFSNLSRLEQKTNS